MGAYNFWRGLRKDQVADLTAGVDVVERLQSVGVPEADAPVLSATSCG